MFERYTESARRAIFYARAVTLLNDGPTIDSVHLLYGLMWEEVFRVEILFHLREIFPLHYGGPHKYATLKEIPVRHPPLIDESKKILARTALEADTLGDYWIDTEHLLLGTLAEKDCQAAQHLAKAGVTFGSAQRIVVANKSSHPEYGRVPTWWALRSAVELWILKWMARVKSLTRSG